VRAKEEMWLIVGTCLALSACNCDCGRGEAEERLVALEARAEAVVAEVELADLGADAEHAPLVTDAPRLIVTVDRAVVDESVAIRFILGNEPDAPVPDVPSDLVLVAELDDGRMREDPPALVDERLDPLGARMTARHDDPDHWLISEDGDLFVDRRLSWSTADQLCERVRRRGLHPRLVVRGPAGPQRLPTWWLVREIDYRYCRPSTNVEASSPTRLVPIAREARPDAGPRDYCARQRGFHVTLRDDGHAITDHRGFIVTPDCASLEVGAIETESAPTIPRTGEAYDFERLADCARTLREHSPDDQNVKLSARGDAATVDDYVQTFRALRGTVAGPVFDAVY